MKYPFLILLSLMTWGKIYAQVSALTDVVYNNVKFDVVQVIVDAGTAKNFSFQENRSLLPHATLLTQQLSDSDHVFLINASIVDSLCRPLGWYVDGGQELQGLNEGDGAGNFYLNPNGALIISDNAAYIIESDSVQSIQGARLAIQSGPMLVNDGDLNPQIRKASTNVNLRCGVGIRVNNGQKELVFAISQQPINFYNFAIFMRDEFECDDVLCLESAGVVMKIPFFGSFSDQSQHTICRYLRYDIR